METYHLCNQHELDCVKKKMSIKQKGGIRIETHEFEVPKSIGSKQKDLNTSKGVGTCRELSSIENKVVGDIEKLHYNEDNNDLVHLAADHAKLTFQGFNNAEEVARNLSTEFNNKIHRIRKEYDNKKITHCIGKHKPTVLYEKLTDG